MAEQSVCSVRKGPNFLSEANSFYWAVVIMCTVILTINSTLFCRQFSFVCHIILMKSAIVSLHKSNGFICNCDIMCFHRVRTEI
jgi:hypothetical protein